MTPKPTKAELVKAIRGAAQDAWEKHFAESEDCDAEDRPSEYELRSEALSHAVRIAELLKVTSADTVMQLADKLLAWLKSGPATPAEPKSDEA